CECVGRGQQGRQIGGKATKPPKTSAYSKEFCHVALSVRPSFKRGHVGSVLGCHDGALRLKNHITTPMAAKAAHMSRWVRNTPSPSTSRGVKKADRAVPPIPIPNTPVANPRRPASYQALTKGIPTANEVPAIPRKNPHSSNSP